MLASKISKFSFSLLSRSLSLFLSFFLSLSFSLSLFLLFFINTYLQNKPAQLCIYPKETHKPPYNNDPKS